jgi:sulfatase maturation enzyme AslB (radical SAM superfamily)
MQQIRQSIRDGKPHDYCYNCVQAERYGRSERYWHNEVSPEFDATTATDFEHQPVLIDVRWNTTCNLSCNYCAPACSSKWASLKGIPVKSGTTPYYEQVCDYFSQDRDHIREVALVGGEPLLLKENERLLDVIPKDCVVTLITNASVALENNAIFEKLSRRRNVGWSLSFDNIGSRFEYVRHGATWTQLERNIDLIQNLMHTQGHWGGIHAVYNIYNATHVLELTEFARHKGLTIHWQSLYQPEFLDPARLGTEVVALARLELHSILDSDWLTTPEQQFLQSVLDNLQVKDDLRPMLKHHITEIENLYHKDQQGKFAELWPEIDTLC